MPAGGEILYEQTAEQSGRRGDRGEGRYSSGNLAPLAGAPQVKGASGPDQSLVGVAEQYAKDNGINLRRQSEYVEVDEDRARRIAQAYDEMPHAPQDPAVREAYQDLIRQTTDQYRALDSAGYKFWFIDINSDAGQQYASSPFNAMRDLRANKSMGVFPTDSGFGTKEDFNPESNPMLADTGLRWPFGGPNGELRTVYANDLFRAVHDAFGHGMEGSGFRAQGEENAWQAHIRLFTGPARGAITTETRGQNSWLNYGPYGERNRTAKTEDTVFADQKTGLMPEWTWTEGRAADEVATPQGEVGAQRYMPAGDMATGRGVKDHREAMDLFEKGYRLYGALYDGMEDPVRLKKASEIERFDPENLWAVPSKKIAAAISVRNMPADLMPSPDSAMPGAYSFPGGYRALPGKAKGSLRIYGPAGSLIGIAASLDEAQRIIRKKAKQ